MTLNKAVSKFTAIGSCLVGAKRPHHMRKVTDIVRASGNERMEQVFIARVEAMTLRYGPKQRAQIDALCEELGMPFRGNIDDTK